MKKIIAGLLVVSAVMLSVGASVWEGAALSAGPGELPETGYYVATNSFPRNTVVDVVNLETGKSIRVIVVKGLDTPGLLAVLSPEAAEAVGMRSRTLGRVRMTMPADPIAFSRFTEGRTASGDPDHDPAAAVAAAVPPAPVAETAAPVAETAAPVAETAAPVAETATPVAETATTETPESPITEAAIIVEAPTADIPAPETSIVDVPEAYVPPEAELPTDESIVVEPEPAAAGAVPPPPIPPMPDTVELTLVPAEERPPEPGPEAALPPEAEISAIPEEPLPESPPPVLPEADFVPPIAAAEPVPEPAVPQVAPPPATASAEPPVPAAAAPVLVPVEPMPHPSAAVASPAPAELPPPIFSAPLIGSLEKGKYYLQLGAFGNGRTVESELKKISENLPLVIQKAGSEEKPVYRILVGPVNLGESAALLQRFKRGGYPDAFIRQES